MSSYGQPGLLWAKRRFLRLAVPKLADKNAGRPKFRSLEQIPMYGIRDAYYDSNGLLAAQGTTVRRRNGHWEALIRQPRRNLDIGYFGAAFDKERVGDKNSKINKRGKSSSSSNSGNDIENKAPYFIELHGKFDIAKYLDSISGGRLAMGDCMADNDLGLQMVASFKTQRRLWKVDRLFYILLDKTHFGYVTGQVQMVYDFKMPEEDEHYAVAQTLAEEEAIEAVKAQIVEDMEARIDVFMGHYAWAFVHGEPQSKVEAFHEFMERRKAEKLAKESPPYNRKPEAW